MKEKDLSPLEIELITIYRKCTDKQQEKILSYANSIGWCEDDEFKTWVKNRGISEKQIKNIISIFIDHNSVDKLKEIFNNDGCICLEQMKSNNNLYDLYPDMKRGLIKDLFNETGKNGNDVSIGKGEILSKLTLYNVVPDNGDVIIEQDGQKNNLEYKGDFGELIGHANYSILECNKSIKKYLDPDEPSPYLNSTKLKTFLEKKVYNKGIDFDHHIHPLTWGFLKKYPNTKQIEDIYSKSIEFLKNYKENIFKIHTYKRKYKGHNIGDLKSVDIDTSYIIYMFLMIDLIYYQRTCKWDYLTIFASSEGPNFGRYEFIPANIINSDFHILYNFLINHNIKWGTTGIDANDTRKQAIKIKLDFK